MGERGSSTSTHGRGPWAAGGAPGAAGWAAPSQRARPARTAQSVTDAGHARLQRLEAKSRQTTLRSPAKPEQASRFLRSLGFNTTVLDVHMLTVNRNPHRHVGYALSADTNTLVQCLRNQEPVVCTRRRQIEHSQEHSEPPFISLEA